MSPGGVCWAENAGEALMAAMKRAAENMSRGELLTIQACATNGIVAICREKYWRPKCGIGGGNAEMGMSSSENARMAVDGHCGGATVGGNIT